MIVLVEKEIDITEKIDELCPREYQFFFVCSQSFPSRSNRDFTFNS